jgi:hypothetical protein
MNRPCLISSLVVIAVCFLVLLAIKAGECSEPSAFLLTDTELDNLLAPIALYPDPVLAQILPASTYPSEVIDAAAWVGGGGDISSIDEQNWDDSVKAVAHYPDVLNMMASNIDWTADLGDAFMNQPDDVISSIQRLRWQARALGNLESDDQETVSIDGDYIEIIPAQPEYIYVPQYNPTVIFVRRWAPGIPRFMTFGHRIAIGAWLSMDFDWRNHHLTYHGWNRPGWVNNARPYVHVKNIYINKSRPYISQTWLHDVSHGDPYRYRTSHPGGTHGGKYARLSKVRGTGITSNKPATEMFGPTGDVRTFSNRGRESLGASRTRPETPITTTVKSQTTTSLRTFAGRIPSTARITVIGKPQTTSPPRPLEGPAAPGTGMGFSQPGPARGSAQPARTSSTAFGGYRGTNETRVISNRGQTSRQSSVGISAFTAPASRVRTPEVRQSPADKKLR